MQHRLPRPWSWVRPHLRAGSAPWPVTLTIGAGLVVVGAFLMARPLTAVHLLGLWIGLGAVLTGISHWITLERSDLAWSPRSLLPAGWLAAAVVFAVWAGRNPGLFVPAVAGLLAVAGIVAVVGFVRGPAWSRVPRLLLGLADLVFAALALLWPDATLVMVGVLFGGRSVVWGLVVIARGIQQWRTPETGVTDASGATSTSPATSARRQLVGRIVGSLGVLTLAIGTALWSHALRAGPVVIDAFYDTPASLPDSPGQLLRYETYDGQLPTGMTGWRIYYTTTNEFDQIVPSTGILAVPTNSDAPAPLISWSHGTVGVARRCAPSLGDDPLAAIGTPAVDQLADHGWAMVATDYPGMGAEGDAPYLIGQSEGRATLDAARAARQMPQVDLAEQTVIWGHSQGGHAALWAGALAADYAPDLSVVGTAALSPASDPFALATRVLAHPEALGASLAIAYVVDSYAGYYPQIEAADVLTPPGRVIVREAASRCTTQGATLVTALAGLAIARDQSIVQSGALDGAFGDLLRANIVTAGWNAPLFIGAGADDEVIDISINDAYVESLEEGGIDVDYRTYPGGTHINVLEPGSALSTDLVAWTETRLEEISGG